MRIVSPAVDKRIEVAIREVAGNFSDKLGYASKGEFTPEMTEAIKLARNAHHYIHFKYGTKSSARDRFEALRTAFFVAERTSSPLPNSLDAFEARYALSITSSSPEAMAVAAAYITSISHRYDVPRVPYEYLDGLLSSKYQMSLGVAVSVVEEANNIKPEYYLDGISSMMVIGFASSERFRETFRREIATESKKLANEPSLNGENQQPLLGTIKTRAVYFVEQALGNVIRKDLAPESPTACRGDAPCNNFK